MRIIDFQHDRKDRISLYCDSIKLLLCHCVPSLTYVSSRGFAITEIDQVLLKFL